MQVWLDGSFLRVLLQIRGWGTSARESLVIWLIPIGRWTNSSIDKFPSKSIHSIAFQNKQMVLCTWILTMRMLQTYLDIPVGIHGSSSSWNGGKEKDEGSSSVLELLWKIRRVSYRQFYIQFSSIFCLLS